MPRGSVVQDAERFAILKCARGSEERGHEVRKGRTPRLLVMSDCLGILIGIEAAWRRGSAWGLRKSKRAGWMEELLGIRSRWGKGGGSIVILWVPSHKGIYANAYADAAAKAHVGDAVSGMDGRTPERRTARIGYATKSRRMQERAGSKETPPCSK